MVFVSPREVVRVGHLNCGRKTGQIGHLVSVRVEASGVAERVGFDPTDYCRSRHSGACRHGSSQNSLKAASIMPFAATMRPMPVKIVV